MSKNIVYYSTYCNNCNNLLNILSKNGMQNSLNFIKSGIVIPEQLFIVLLFLI